MNVARARWWVMALVGALALNFVAPPAGADAQQALPSAVANAVQAAFLTQVGTSQSGVTLVRHEAVTWPNGCMGIEEGNVLCTQALVDGWVVWVSSDNAGFRFHANLDGSITRLAQSQIPLDTIATAGIPASAPVRPAGGFTGTRPGPGQLGLLVTSGVVGTDTLVGALAADGCAVRSLAVLESGAWRVYIPGAPAVVNVDFPPALVSLTPFAVRCA